MPKLTTKSVEFKLIREFEMNNVSDLTFAEIEAVNGGGVFLAAGLIVAVVGLVAAAYSSGHSTGKDMAERDNRADAN